MSPYYEFDLSYDQFSPPNSNHWLAYLISLLSYGALRIISRRLPMQVFAFETPEVHEYILITSFFFWPIFTEISTNNLTANIETNLYNRVLIWLNFGFNLDRSSLQLPSSSRRSSSSKPTCLTWFLLLFVQPAVLERGCLRWPYFDS